MGKRSLGLAREGKSSRTWKVSGTGEWTFAPSKGELPLNPGSQYDGHWEEGLEHGTGILTHPNGMRSEGEFREGKPWNTRAYDSNRKLLFRVQQGAIIRKNDD